MNSGLSDLKAEAARLGATVEDTKVSVTHECRVMAPKGHHWKGDGLHEFVDAAYIPWKPAYADLIDRMKHGVEPCTPETCELWADGGCEWWEDEE